ncbi:hypothetical protein SDC9_66568 [bioreactor metagenome]|uniref:Uncharacterized protein n=1 Tax=bioreactor metagenome TaxID=1076179 RepID=A0A644XVN1_9ZZZZ
MAIFVQHKHSIWRSLNKTLVTRFAFPKGILGLPLLAYIQDPPRDQISLSSRVYNMLALFLNPAHFAGRMTNAIKHLVVAIRINRFLDLLKHAATIIGGHQPAE